MNEKKTRTSKPSTSKPRAKQSSSEKTAADATGEAQKWYADGLKFKCSGCGDCCTGAPGNVWVNKQEIQDLANSVDMTVEEFHEAYVRRVGVRYSLKEFDDGDCVFFDSKNRNCGVYDARPRQCRSWPFWTSNLKSPETWEQTCDVCPGSGTGKLYSLTSIEQQRKMIRI